MMFVLFRSGRLAALLAAAAWRLTHGVVLAPAALRSLDAPSTSDGFARQAGHDQGGGEVAVSERIENVSRPPRPYTTFGYMSTKLGEAAFPWRPWTTLELLNKTTGSRMVAFNPSLVRLPDFRKMLHPRAVYAAAVRLEGGQCDRLASGQLAAKQPGTGSALMVLDKDFHVLLSVPITNLDGSESEGEDVKLLRKHKSVWATYMTYHGPAEARYSMWHMRQLRLHRESEGSVQARYGSNEVVFKDERNMGVFGQAGDQMGLVWWLGDEPGKSPNSSTVRVTSSLHESPESGVLHQSHHPLELAELGLFLTVAHEHLDSGNGPCEGCTPEGVPLYGYKYLSKFVLFEVAPPHRTRSLSPLFCFPSGVDDTCETIQIVGSLVRDGDDILISYGVNDCESRVLRVPLALVLTFANGTSGP